jgi:hypothetical protein
MGIKNRASVRYAIFTNLNKAVTVGQARCFLSPTVS